jgi:hypothetical protein
MSRFIALSFFLFLGVSHARTDGLNMTKWANSQKKSLMKMAQQHDVATAGRLLASHGLVCSQLAIMGIVIPGLMMPYAIMLPELYGKKDIMCSSYKATEACKAKTMAACNSGCEPDGEECGQFGMGMLADIVNADAGSLWEAVVAAAETCNTKAKSSCTGTCEWKVEGKTGKCDMAGSVFLEGDDALCKRPDWINIMEEAVKCSKVADKADCGGKCEYKAEEMKCDLSGAEFAKLVYGVKAAASLATKMEAQAPCTADKTCSAAGCTNLGDSCAAGISAWSKSMMDKGATCGKKTEATCLGDCAMEHDHRRLSSHEGSDDEHDGEEHDGDKCDLSETYLDTECGGGAAATADGATCIGTFVPLLFALTALSVQF